ncbi:hypothetical protein J4474_01435 [Candidatus Pacearchaeota archaeon]|nr:hypothetical protein [Candidatus Pacearchaeota archaeon]
MKTHKAKYEKVDNKLSGIRNNLKWEKVAIACYSAPLLVRDLALNLAYAGREGNLREDQYEHIFETPRADLSCEYLHEAREIWKRNKERFGVKTSGPRCWFGNEKARILEKNVYRLTKAQLNRRYDIKDYRLSRPGREIYPQDVHYGRFLRANGLFNEEGAKITEADLPSLESIFKSNQPDVMKKHALIQRFGLSRGK